jgi:hypothetical protein
MMFTAGEVLFTLYLFMAGATTTVLALEESRVCDPTYVLPVIVGMFWPLLLVQIIVGELFDVYFGEVVRGVWDSLK